MDGAGAYEGWTNRATWNVELWLNNKEPLYRVKEHLLDTACDRRFSATHTTDVARFAEKLRYWLANGIIDGKPCRFHCDISPTQYWLVNFTEIAEHEVFERELDQQQRGERDE